MKTIPDDVKHNLRSTLLDCTYCTINSINKYRTDFLFTIRTPLCYGVYNSPQSGRGFCTREDMFFRGKYGKYESLRTVERHVFRP